MAAEYDNLLAAWNWFVARDDLEAVRTLILGLYWIAYRQGWGYTFKLLLEAAALKLTADESVRGHDPELTRERALVRATIAATILLEMILLGATSRVGWGGPGVVGAG